MAEQKEKMQRRLSGTVASSQPEKTIVVVVQRTKLHPKYHKRFTVTRRYHVHDERKQYKVGDKVTFAACRPISKLKRWRVLYS